MEESPGERGDADGKKEVADSVGRVRVETDSRGSYEPGRILLFLPPNVETKDPSAWRVRVVRRIYTCGKHSGTSECECVCVYGYGYGYGYGGDDDSRRDGRARSETVGERTGLVGRADELWVRSQAEAAFALWVLAK